MTKQGRPTKHTQAAADEICRRIALGDPLEEILRTDDSLPKSSTTVREWMKHDTAFSDAIARARLDGYDAIADGARLTARGRGESTLDVQRDKLIIETDLKLLAKWDPNRYGNTTNLNHTGNVTVAWPLPKTELDG